MSLDLYYRVQAALSPHMVSATELASAMSSIWPLIESQAMQPTDDDIRRCLDEFASPTIGSGSIHGGDHGRIIYDASMPFVVRALRDLFAEEVNRQVTIGSNVAKALSASMRDNVRAHLALRRVIDVCTDEEQHSDGVLIGRVLEVAMNALGIKIDEKEKPDARPEK